MGFARWRSAAILVPVPRAELAHILGLGHEDLLGAHASAVVNTRALLDHQVQPRAWRPMAPARTEPRPTGLGTSEAR